MRLSGSWRAVSPLACALACAAPRPLRRGACAQHGSPGQGVAGAGYARSVLAAGLCFLEHHSGSQNYAFLQPQDIHLDRDTAPLADRQTVLLCMSSEAGAAAYGAEGLTHVDLFAVCRGARPAATRRCEPCWQESAGCRQPLENNLSNKGIRSGQEKALMCMSCAAGAAAFDAGGLAHCGPVCSVLGVRDAPQCVEAGAAGGA